MFSSGPGGDADVEILWEFSVGFSPPVVLAWLPFHEFSEREIGWFDRDRPFTPFAVMGLLGWAGLMALFVGMAHEQFRRLANREPRDLPRPPRRAADLTDSWGDDR